MPKCVSSWIAHKDPAKIFKIQRELIEVYENDFSKYSGRVNSGLILMVFRSIVAQLKILSWLGEGSEHCAALSLLCISERACNENA